MHYVAERMHSITGKRALKHRAVCTKLSVFTSSGNAIVDICCAGDYIDAGGKLNNV